MPVLFRSPHPDVVIPDSPMSPFVLEHADARASRPAFVEGPSGQALSYGDLLQRIAALQRELTRRGIEEGDVVALYCPNVPDFAVAFHAVARLGGITTTVNPLCSAEELLFQLHDADARMLVTTRALLGKSSEIIERSGVEQVVVLEGQARAKSAGVASGHSRIRPKTDLAVLPYSSGTTGRPKGVMLTHSNIVANLCQVAAVHHVNEEDRVVAVLPFSHIYGLNIVMNLPLRAGATLITMPRFDLELFLRVISEQHATLAYVVPPIVFALARHPSVLAYDLSSLRLVVSGAAPLDEHLQEACRQRLGCPVIQGYGMTETSPVTHLNPDTPYNKTGSVGVPVPNTECKVVDLDSRAELPSGEMGEICVRGPQVMAGYHRESKETARVIDSERWLHTGDVGYADGDGYFHIVDRLKELIKYKGYQVAPAELESVLLSHPAVADAAVVGSRDHEAGEVPVAFVALKGEADREELMSFVAERVAPFKRIRSVRVVAEIPRSPAGKVLRRQLTKAASGGSNS